MLKLIKRKVSYWINSIYYYFATHRNQYYCKLIGEKLNPQEKSNTIILYRLLGKRDIFEISIRELLDNRDLLEKFHPTEAVKLGAIAMGDMLSTIEHDATVARFQEIKRKMLDATRG